MKTLKKTNNNKYLSEVLTGERWIECLSEVSGDIAVDFPKLITDEGKNAVGLLVESKMVSKYLLSGILTEYGRQQVLFANDTTTIAKINNILFDWLKDVALVYMEIINLSPEQIINYSKSQINTSGLMKNNDSQFHSNVVEEFANEYVNLEQMTKSDVKQGNNMNVLKNLIKYGYGLEIETIVKRFSVLVGNSWSINYQFKENFEGDFEYNE